MDVVFASDALKPFNIDLSVGDVVGRILDKFHHSRKVSLSVCRLPLRHDSFMTESLIYSRKKEISQLRDSNLSLFEVAFVYVINILIMRLMNKNIFTYFVHAILSPRCFGAFLSLMTIE